MEQYQQRNEGISQEFREFGFVTNLARRGVITVILGVLVFLLMGSVGLCMWLASINAQQAKEHRVEINERDGRHTEILLELLKTQSNTKRSVDSIFAKPGN